MRVLALIVLLCAGCAGCAVEPLYVHSNGGLDDERATAIDDASEILGVPLVDIPWRYGAIEIRWQTKRFPCADKMADGCAGVHQIGCFRHVETRPIGVVLAHEIGHAMGLGHVEDRADLMYEHASAPTEFAAFWEFADEVVDFQRCVVTVEH